MTQADLICEIENSATRTFSQIGKLPIDLFDFRKNGIAGSAAKPAEGRLQTPPPRRKMLSDSRMIGDHS